MPKKLTEKQKETIWVTFEGQIKKDIIDGTETVANFATLLSEINTQNPAKVPQTVVDLLHNVVNDIKDVEKTIVDGVPIAQLIAQSVENIYKTVAGWFN